MTRLYLFFSFTFAFLFLVVLSVQAESQDQIKIGVLTDLSGVASYYGTQTRLGALVAEQDIKAEGGNIAVLFDDSALNTTRALSAAQKLLYVDQVDAMYVDFSIIANAVSSLLQQNKKLLLYSAAAESIAKNNPYAFKSYSDYSLGCEALVREFKKRGIKKIGILKTETEYGELCLSGAKKADPDVIALDYQQGQSVSSQVLVMKQKKVEALINGSFEIDITNMIQAAKTINYHVKFGAPEDGLITKNVFEKYSDIIDGSLTFGLVQNNPDIEARMKKIRGGEAVIGAEAGILAYIHVKQMYYALRACPDKNIDCIVSNFSQSKPEVVLGFEGWKNRMARVRTFIKEISNGEGKVVGSYVMEP